ncbi:GTPase-activating Rap/Ran-GAP domain-like protein 3 isoform X1 [Cryptotermes secundus]|uniref:GTPase-activating Rap/Ran-GAP domain-like protein 3 isoform X1 n=1 Tax=Cryptotermes secundus TaxID=105785 RepID=UPI001454D8D7|nr:GTPase-activating Rap/Ran-GAP domain-like protein 3 isoform X1 [Cryptotermes secundus]
MSSDSRRSGMSRNALLEVNIPKKCLGMMLGTPLCKSGSSLDLTALSKSEDDQQTSREGKLRRVFTTHARRRSTRKKELVPGFNLSHMMKEPLRVVHSVPLSFPNGSSTNDLISRRGVFSRRHYGSVELLPQIESDGQELNGRRFRVENGETLGEKEEIFGSPSTPILENPEYQTRWYFKYFLGKLHQNYVGADGDKTPFFLSVVLTDANNQCVPQYRAILWKKTGAQKISIPYTPNKPMTVKQILSNFPNMEKLEKGPKEIFTPDIQKDLLLLEEQEGSVNFKFGVLYTRPGQNTDDEMFSNEAGSPEFNRFISLLGDKVRLKGWDKYRGGLDVKGDMTGRFSVYTIYEGHEIMFHVSTLLPYSKDNRQQVERKRHIGNDIVNIVFLDGGATQMNQFNPSFIKSQFTHVFALVTYSLEDSSYRLALFSEESVPLFGPSLPCPPVFRDSQEFREFLIVKLINGEKAAFNTPTFAQKRERTLDMLIKDLFSEHMNDGRGTMLNRRAFSDVLPDPPRGSRRKEEARQVEFVRIGQALKLDTIVKGDAPTSLATTGLFKRAPWEPQCFYPDFGHEIICGDSWGETRLLVATESGVYLVEESMSHRLVFDKTVAVKQLHVVEAHGILLFRADKGRDSKIHVFRLSDFDGDFSNEGSARGRQDLKEHRLERTRGCHMYAISRAGGSHLRMVVAIGKKLLVMQWRHSAAWTAWCPASDTDTVDGFQYIREIQVPEPPQLITLVDSSLSGSSGGGIADNHICVGYRHQFDLVNERTGEVSRLHAVEGSRTHLVAAVDLYEDEEPELLLCYNHTCHFQKLSEESASSTEFDFHWNFVPTVIVCAFPYIFAFTTDSMEIRLIINGNLVQTMVLPKLTLICSKNDIFFATTAPEFFHNKAERLQVDRPERDPSISPPSSPHSSPEARPFRLYRIPLHTLSGMVAPCDRRCPTPSEPASSSGNDTSSESARSLMVPGESHHHLSHYAENSSGSFLLAEPSRGLSRSCSSSPTPHQPPGSTFLTPK